MERARIGRRLEDVLDDIAEVQELIADARPRTLAGAAVMLRRALAAIGDPGKVEVRLVVVALGVMGAGGSGPCLWHGESLCSHEGTCHYHSAYEYHGLRGWVDLRAPGLG